MWAWRRSRAAPSGYPLQVLGLMTGLRAFRFYPSRGTAAATPSGSWRHGGIFLMAVTPSGSSAVSLIEWSHSTPKGSQPLAFVPPRRHSTLKGSQPVFGRPAEYRFAIARCDRSYLSPRSSVPRSSFEYDIGAGHYCPSESRRDNEVLHVPATVHGITSVDPELLIEGERPADIQTSSRRMPVQRTGDLSKNGNEGHGEEHQYR